MFQTVSQTSTRITENQTKSSRKTTENYLNWEIYNSQWGCRKARDLWGSDSVRSATICCIPRRTKPTGCSCTPAGDWRHNHSDLAFVCRAQGIDEIVLNQELWFSSVSRLELHLCEQNHPWDQWDGQHLHRCYPGEAQLSDTTCDLMWPGPHHAPVRWSPLSPVSPQRGCVLPVRHQEGGGGHEALLCLHQHKLLSPLVRMSNCHCQAQVKDIDHILLSKISILLKEISMYV